MEGVSYKQVFLNNIFKTVDLSEFLNPLIENENLNVFDIWNVTLLLNQTDSFNYQPLINTLLNDFNENISVLHENVRAYSKRLIEPLFELGVSIESDYSPEEAIVITDGRSKSFKRMINGRLDCLNTYYRKDESEQYTKSLELIEFKCSGLEECSQQWIIQTLLYSYLYTYEKKVTITKYTIVNFRTAKTHTFTLDQLKDPSVCNLLCDAIIAIGPKFNYHEAEIMHFIDMIKREI
jgi:hypothetical protein